MADFLFVLCKENVNRLIKYTGYGNAAGLLASRGLMGGVQAQSSGDYSSDDDDSETEEYAMDKAQIDPMIGEFLYEGFNISRAESNHLVRSCRHVVVRIFKERERGTPKRFWERNIWDACKKPVSDACRSALYNASKGKE